jgi:hypothetical protein
MAATGFVGSEKTSLFYENSLAHRKVSVRWMMLNTLPHVVDDRSDVKFCGMMPIFEFRN